MAPNPIAKLFLVFFLISQIEGDLNVIKNGVQGSSTLNFFLSVDDFITFHSSQNFGPDSGKLIQTVEHSPACSDNLPGPPAPSSVDKIFWILLASDFRCSPDEMAMNAERLGYAGIIIYPFQSHVSFRALNISPSVKNQLGLNVYFTAETAAHKLKLYTAPFVNNERYSLQFGKLPKKPSSEQRTKYRPPPPPPRQEQEYKRYSTPPPPPPRQKRYTNYMRRDPGAEFKVGFNLFTLTTAVIGVILLGVCLYDPRNVEAIRAARNVGGLPAGAGLYHPQRVNESPSQNQINVTEGVRVLRDVLRDVPEGFHLREGSPVVKRFCCLGRCLDKYSPSESQAEFLNRNGLGYHQVHVSPLADSTEVVAFLTTAFPKLAGHRFQLMISSGTGNGPMEPLSPLLRGVGVASGRLITQCTGTIYIRPLGLLLFDLGRQNPPFLRLPSSNIPPAQVHPNGPPSLVELVDTIEAYRTQLYAENPGVVAFLVRREQFLPQIMELYQDEARFVMRAKCKPHIVFCGEDGQDGSGLRKEYFSMIHNALTNHRLEGNPLFDGPVEHKVPSENGIVVGAGVFRTIGRMLVHSFMHTGVAMYGLSQPVVKFLCTKNYVWETANFEAEDVQMVYSPEAENMIRILDGWTTEQSLSAEDNAKLNKYCELIDYVGTRSVGNVDRIKEAICFHEVIGSRKNELMDLKEAFVTMGVTDFLDTRRHLWTSVFPRFSEMRYSWREVFHKLQFRGGPELVGVFTRFCSLFQAFLISIEGEQMTRFIRAVTAWPALPEGKITVNIRSDEEAEFFVRTCTLVIEIPLRARDEEILGWLNLLIDYGEEGFGSR